MNTDRIKEIQETTAYPESVSVKQALLQVWNECEQEKVKPATPNAVGSVVIDELRDLVSFCDSRCEHYNDNKSIEELLSNYRGAKRYNALSGD